MRISGHLSDTTLGDVLGSLYRARVTGLVRLTETMGSGAGRRHGIYLSRGEIIAVDTPIRVMPLGEILRQRGLLDGAAQRRVAGAAGQARKIGEVLIEEYRISPDVVGAALRQQLRTRLEALFMLREALLSFHVVGAHPENPVPPLAARDYLNGRPRARDRAARSSGWVEASPRPRGMHGRRLEALNLLGLDEDATLSDVTRAFRELASQFHPDRHLGASEAERRTAQQRFAALSAAYHTLIG